MKRQTNVVGVTSVVCSMASKSPAGLISTSGVSSPNSFGLASRNAPRNRIEEDELAHPPLVPLEAGPSAEQKPAVGERRTAS